MVKCQFCDKFTHRSMDCPIRARRILGKRTTREEDEIKCDECGQLGHVARDCPMLGCDGGEDAGDYEEEEDMDDAATHVSKCDGCEAERDEECRMEGGGGDACPFAADRQKAIDKMKASRDGGGGGDDGADGGEDEDDKQKVTKKQRVEDLKKGFKPGTTAPLQERDIKNLKASDIPLLPLLVILPHRRWWRMWVWNKQPKDRKDAFDRLKAAVAQKFEVDKPPVAGVTAVDAERSKKEHEELVELLDPTEGTTTVTALTRRIDAIVMKRGMGLMTYKLARAEGWPVARAAERHMAGEADQEKAWGEAAAVGRRRVAESAGRGGRGGGRGGNGRGGGRGQRG